MPSTDAGPGARTVVTTHGGGTVVGHVHGHHAPRAVVLLHGIGSSARAFRRLVAALEPLAVVHALDLAGFGAAPTPAGNLTVVDHADLVARYVEEHVTGAGLAPPVVVGHSMGAQVAGQLLADHPDAGVAAVLLGPTAVPGARSLVHQAALLALDAVGEHPRSVAVLLVDALVRCGPVHYLRQQRCAVRHRLEDVLSRVPVPVLVVRGAHDPVSPRGWVRRLATAAPRGAVRTVRGRHHAMDTDPAGLAAVVREAWAVAETGRR